MHVSSLPAEQQYAGSFGTQRLYVLLVQVKHDLAKLQLTSPVCTKEKEKIALSRRVEKHWRLIGWGSISAGVLLETSVWARHPVAC